jgi:2-oxoglutarate ferredoxin oxidoreductase subunit delta
MKSEELQSKFWRKPLDAESFSPPRGEVHILANRCKGCGFCIEFCPKSSLETSSGFNEKGYHPPEKRDGAECVNCGLCELICPELAIYTKRVDGSNDKD